MRSVPTILVLSALGAAACSSNGGSLNNIFDAGATNDSATAVDVGVPTDSPSTDTGVLDAGTDQRDASGTDAVVKPDVVPGDVVASDAPASDAPASDVPTSDVPTSDSGLDGATGSDAATADAAADAGPGNPCAAGAIINLSTAGTVTGATTRYVGNDDAVPATGGLTPTCRTPGHQVVFQYTARTASHLLVSTADMATTFDTVAWATDACASTGVELGCDDDFSGSMPALASRFTTATIVRAGATVFIGVGGYSTNHGAFGLTVTEVPEVAIGAACDTTGTANACATGSSCQGTGTAAVCVANGASGGLCRTGTGATACDTGLVCGINGTCVTAIAVGAACSPTSAPCATGSACIAMVCVADGAAGGHCRTTAPACATGLGCSGDPTDPTTRCRATVAVGGACDPTRAMNVCATGYVCLAGPTAGTNTCQNPPYVESALPSPTWIDACATGGTHVTLVADSGRDDNHVAAAIALPFAFQFVRTAVTTVWPDTNGFAQFGTEPGDNTGGTGTFPSTGDGALVAPFWDDLVLRDPVAPSTAESLCVRTVGTAPNRQFAIEWLDAYRYTHMATHLTFEVVLTETTNTVDFIYNTLTGTGADATFVDGSNAAVGLQSDMGAVTIAHTGTVSTSTGIRFTPR